MWLTKNYHQKIQQEYKIENKLLEVKGVSYELEIYQSKVFGQIARINETLLLQNWLNVQSEFLAHIATCSHKEPKRVLIAGSFNLEIAYEFLKHTFLSVDFLQFDLKVLESLISFFPHYQEVFKHPNFTHIPQRDGDFFTQNKERKYTYDLILALNGNEKAFVPLLSESGILITKIPHLLLDTQGAKEKLESLGNFLVKMPFFIPLAIDLDESYCLASKKYHPTADIMLQRADMLEDLEYYHANLHLSAFILPKSVKVVLFGVSKN